mgnify:FL=1
MNPRKTVPYSVSVISLKTAETRKNIESHATILVNIT